MSQTLKSVFGERPTPSSAAKRDTTNDNEAASNLLRMATHKRKKTHHPPPSATSTSLSSQSTAMKAPPVVEIRLTGNNDEDVVDLNDCGIENPSGGGGTELDFSGCEDESQDLLVEPVPPVSKPKQSAVELLLLQQTQETTQESIAQQTSDTLQFAAAGTDTQESLAKAREVGKQQAIAFGATLSDDSDDGTDVDTCCANKYCRAKGMNWKPQHACNSCKGMVHLICNRADETGLEVCLECVSKAW